MLYSIKDLFKIKKGEQRIAIIMFFILLILNVSSITSIWGYIAATKHDANFYELADAYVVSGFDPYVYSFLSNGVPRYTIIRHPFVALLLTPLWAINQLLWNITGYNCCLFLIFPFIIFSAFYGLIFLRRILKDIIGLRSSDATNLTLLFFSFGYVMVGTMHPDHFIYSFFLMMLVINVCGRHLRQGKDIGWKKTLIMFIATAGITLSNGIKVFISALFVNGKKFFKPRYILYCAIIPALAIWIFANIEDSYIYNHIRIPYEEINKQKFLQADKKWRAKELKLFMDTAKIAKTCDSIAIMKGYNEVIRKHIIARYKRNHARDNIKNAQTISDIGYMRWTDISTPRIKSLWHNMFGESIQLHKENLLEDIHRTRPLFVYYKHSINYIVEGIIIALFLIGIFFGRRDKFMWMCMSCFGFDMFIHVVLGFAINEIYIMTLQWAWILPITFAYIIKRMAEIQHKPLLLAVRTLFVSLAVFLFCYNGSLILKFFL